MQHLSDAAVCRNLINCTDMGENLELHAGMPDAKLIEPHDHFPMWSIQTFHFILCLAFEPYDTVNIKQRNKCGLKFYVH
jgi:hypothetical protein